MSIYETTFIINPQTDDASIDGGVQSVSDLITGNGGKVIHQDRMGTRRLAYQIKGLSQGYYTTIIFEGPSRILPVLNRHFKQTELFVRHLTILYEGDVKAFAEPEKAEVAEEAKPDKDRAPAKITSSTDDEKTVRVETESEAKPVEEELPEVVEKEADVGPTKPDGYQEDEEL